MATSSQSNLSRTIFVAVDFGTTFSGVAWAAAALLNEQQSIIQWPDAYSSQFDGVTSEKVPTELVYSNNGIRWGFQIKEGEKRHRWFKLGLDPESDQIDSKLDRDYPDDKLLPPLYGSTPPKMPTDYLKALREHVFAIMGTKLTPTAIQNTTFVFIVTVPAMWKDRAKDLTRRCARDAGMGENVKIISEPEAAAIHSLKMMVTHESLTVGQAVIICDCGGGTVDLITYEIMELKPMLKVCKATSGRGGVCGVPVGGLRDDAIKGVQGGKYRMTGNDLAEIFAPIITEILALVQDQVSASSIAPSAILLVGGFGASPYLREQLKRAFPTITVKQPPNGWSTVARGSLQKAMAEASAGPSTFSIASRVARRYLGVTVQTPFVKGVHRQKKAVWAEKDGFYRVTVVDWLIHKGQTVKELEPVAATFQTSRRCIAGPIKSQPVRFYSFDGDTMPKHAYSHGVKHQVSLTADLSTIPIHQYEVTTGADQAKYYEITFEIKIAFFSAHVDYSLWFQNRSYGAVHAEFTSID